MMHSKLVLFIFLFSFSAQAAELKGIWLNREGVKAFKEQRGTDAHNDFAQSLAEMPFSPEAHFNLGATYYGNKEFDKALQEFDQAAALAKKQNKSEAEFVSRFNAGVAAAEAKKVDEALTQYQQALELKKDSIETKTNIELLVQSQSGGQGGDQDQKDKKDQGGQGNKDQKPQQGQQPQEKQPPQQKPQPKPFNSKEMSQQDVNRITEELKRQEEQIRARYQNEKMKSTPNEKDW